MRPGLHRPGQVEGTPGSLLSLALFSVAAGAVVGLTAVDGAGPFAGLRPAAVAVAHAGRPAPLNANVLFPAPGRRTVYREVAVNDPPRPAPAAAAPLAPAGQEPSPPAAQPSPSPSPVDDGGGGLDP